jgi:hypothetical protein
MLTEFFEQYANQLQTFSIMLMIINAILHVIFAGGVARDAGILYKIGQRPALVSAPAWAFATLIGGVIVAAIYWFIHHSTLTRPVSKEIKYDK